MSEFVKLERRRPSKYTVRWDNGIKEVIFNWQGCKPNSKPYALKIPREAFDYINMGTTAIKNGALVVCEDNVNKEELLSEVIDYEEAVNNARTRDEVEKLLKGNINTMKKELRLVTSRQEKIFIKQVKDDIANTDGLNNTKIEFIDAWFKDEVVE